VTATRLADRLAWLALGAFAALWLARWPTFPLVLDPYYHLFVGRQMAAAGGPIAYEWWQYAPVGRPHLYPPVLHLVLAALLTASCPPLATIRLVSAVLPPLLLLSLWAAVRRLLSPTTALAALLAALTPFAFHLHSAITLAATLGLIELLWLLVAVERGQPLTAAMLLGLLWYTHLGLPWIAVLALGIGGLLHPPVRATLQRSAWGLLLGVPWLAHLWVHRALLVAFPRYENETVELSLFVYAVALLGLWRSWRARGAASWPLACWAAFGLLAFQHQYRWLSGEGMLSVCILAGVGLEAAGRWVAAAAWLTPRWRATPEGTRHTLAVAAAGFLLWLSPTLQHTGRQWVWRWPDAAVWHLLNSPSVAAKPTETSFYVPQIERLVQAVVRQTQPREILWSNAPYVLGLVAALANRPMSSAMLNEVQAPVRFDPIRAAHLIVWFRLAQAPGFATEEQLRAYRLRRVGEDDVAVLYRQEESGPLAQAPRAVLPLWAALAMAGTAAGVAAFGLTKQDTLPKSLYNK